MNKISIAITGRQARFIYKDELHDLLDLGEAKVRRASHVEPIDIFGEIWWQADMSPVGGPKLPPQRHRQDALDAEVAWLKEHRIPVPKEDQ